MISPDVDRVLAREAELARAANRASPTFEDLVRALAQDPVGSNILRNSGADLDALELALASAATRLPSSAPERDLLLGVSQLLTKSAGRELVTLEMLFKMILAKPKARAVRILAKHGVGALDVRRSLAHGTVKRSKGSQLPIARVVHAESAAPAARSKVVFINDDFTTYEFVVDLLCSVFSHPREQAQRIAKAIHDQGQISVGDYETRKARRLAMKATRRAEKKEFPLRVVLEPCE